MNSNDISCLAETKCHDDLQIPGFKLFHKTRKHYTRLSGGIAIAVKDKLTQYIHEIKTESDYVMWIKVDKKVCGSPFDLIIGCCYIPPQGSIYNNPEALNEIELEIINYINNDNPILLLGDFNGKTKLINDLPDVSDNEDDHNNHNNNEFYLPDLNALLIANDLEINRNSQDLNVPNSMGNKLIEFCKCCNFIILNGRCAPDIYGKNTCLDKSVIDYALINEKLLHFIKPQFEVSDFCNLLSDVHSALRVSL